MISRATYLALVVGMTLGSGCGDSGGDSGTETTATGTTGEPGTTGGTTTDPGTTGEPTTTTGTTGATGSTTGESATGTGTTGGAEYCQGFDADAPAPFVEFAALGGEKFADGVTWPLECGGQGLWMFALYPSMGGWDPMDQIVFFDIAVDVEGHNDNPDGHFFSAEMTTYYIGCEIPDGGVVGMIPVFPPDTLADLNELNGLQATVHVVIDAGGQPLVFDSTATLAVSPADVMNGCEFG
jgi:hypothetical protein